MKKFSLVLSLPAIAAVLVGCNSVSFTQVPETVSAGSIVEVVVRALTDMQNAETAPLHLCAALPAGWATPSLTAYRNGGAEEFPVTVDAAIAADAEGKYPMVAAGLSWRCFTSAPLTGKGVETGKVVANVEIPEGASGVQSIFTLGMAQIGILRVETGLAEVRLRVEEPLRDSFDHWSAGDSVGPGDVGNLVYGGGRFVGSSDHRLVLSEDGARWRPIDRTSWIDGIVFGKGKWLFLEDNELYSLAFSEDPDPVIERVATPSFSFRFLVFGAGRFVAVGQHGALLTSEDGVSWARGEMGHWNEVMALESNGSTFVAFTADRALRSSDGLEWRTVQGGFADVASIAHGNGRWIAGSAWGLYESTDDGRSWRKIPAAIIPDGTRSFHSIGFLDGRFLVAATRGVLAGSGSSGWVDLAPGFSGRLGYSFAQSEDVVALGGAYGFIATAQRRTPGAPVIETQTVPAASSGRPYEAQLNVYSGKGAIHLQVVEGALPAGLVLDSGVLVGSPQEIGTFTFTVAAVDEVGARDERAFSLEVAAGAPYLPPSMPPVRVGEPTVHRLPISSGTPPFTLESLQVDPTVATFSLVGSEVIVEVLLPSTSITSTATIRITDANDLAVEASYLLYAVVPPTITAPSSDPAVQGKPFARNYSTTQAIRPLSWTVEGELPEGLRTIINDLPYEAERLLLEGPVTGPAGIYDYTVRLRDAAGWTVELPQTLEVFAPLQVSPASLPPAQPGVAYEATLEISGGLAPIMYWTTAHPPEGFEWQESEDGRLMTLVGMPSELGTSTLVFYVQDSIGQQVHLRLDLVVAHPPSFATAASLPDAEVGELYAAEIEVSGTAPFSFSHDGGLPDGLGFESIEGSYVLSGTPTEAGEFSVEVRVEDAIGFEALQVFTLVVEEADDPADPDPNDPDPNDPDPNDPDPTDPDPTDPDPTSPTKKSKKSSGGCAATGESSLTPLALMVVLALFRRRRR